MKMVLGLALAMMIVLQPSVLAKLDEDIIQMTFTCGEPEFMVARGIKTGFKGWNNGKRLVDGVETFPLNVGNTDIVPYLQDDRMMVPLRPFAEQFGMELHWSMEQPDMIGLTIGDLQIHLQVGAPTAVLNGTTVPIEPPVCLKNDVTYVPLYVLCNWLGLEISWDGNLRKAQVRELCNAELCEPRIVTEATENGIEIGIRETNMTNADFQLPESAKRYTLYIHDLYDNPVFSAPLFAKGTDGMRAFVVPSGAEARQTVVVPLEPGEYHAVLTSYGANASFEYLGYRKIEAEFSYGIEVPIKVTEVLEDEHTGKTTQAIETFRETRTNRIYLTAKDVKKVPAILKQAVPDFNYEIIRDAYSENTLVIKFDSIGHAVQAVESLKRKPGVLRVGIVGGGGCGDGGGYGEGAL